MQALFYHFTREHNVDLIRKIGLQPQVPDPPFMTYDAPVVWLTSRPNDPAWFGAIGGAIMEGDPRPASELMPDMRRITLRLNPKSKRLLHWMSWRGINLKIAPGVPDIGAEHWWVYLGIIAPNRILHVTRPGEPELADAV